MKTLRRKAWILIAAAMIAGAAAGMRAIDNYWDSVAREKQHRIDYPMANQGIIWSGAGYNGIWAGGAGE